MILDLGLPGKDGMEVLRDLRRHGQRLPVIVLTARGDPHDASPGSRRAPTITSASRSISRSWWRGCGRACATTAGEKEEGPARGRHRRARPADPLGERARARRSSSARASSSSCGRSSSTRTRSSAASSCSRSVWGYDYDPGSNVVDVYVGYLRRKIGADAVRDDARRRLPLPGLRRAARGPGRLQAVLGHERVVEKMPRHENVATARAGGRRRTRLGRHREGRNGPSVPRARSTELAYPPVVGASDRCKQRRSGRRRRSRSQGRSGPRWGQRVSTGPRELPLEIVRAWTRVMPSTPRSRRSNRCRSLAGRDLWTERIHPGRGQIPQRARTPSAEIARTWMPKAGPVPWTRCHTTTPATVPIRRELRLGTVFSRTRHRPHADRARRVARDQSCAWTRACVSMKRRHVTTEFPSASVATRRVSTTPCGHVHHRAELPCGGDRPCLHGYVPGALPNDNGVAVGAGRNLGKSDRQRETGSTGPRTPWPRSSGPRCPRRGGPSSTPRRPARRHQRWTRSGGHRTHSIRCKVQDRAECTILRDRPGVEVAVERSDSALPDGDRIAVRGDRDIRAEDGMAGRRDVDRRRECGGRRRFGATCGQCCQANEEQPVSPRCNVDPLSPCPPLSRWWRRERTSSLDLSGAGTPASLRSGAPQSRRVAEVERPDPLGALVGAVEEARVDAVVGARPRPRRQGSTAELALRQRRRRSS